MTKPTKFYEEMATITPRLAELEREREMLRRRAGELVVALLKSGESPTAVTGSSPFSDAHVRTLARLAGIPPASRGTKKAEPK